MIPLSCSHLAVIRHVWRRIGHVMAAFRTWAYLAVLDVLDLPVAFRPPKFTGGTPIRPVRQKVHTLSSSKQPHS